MRLIDADALKDIFTEYYGGRYEYTFVSMSDILNNIGDAPTVPQWISVKDRLPELRRNGVSDAVVALTSRRMKFIAAWDGVTWHGAYMYWYGDEEDENTVTHWMPLPDLPERNEK